MNPPLNPEHILQTWMTFWASKALMRAIEVDVFSEPAGEPQSLGARRGCLGLHPPLAQDSLDALVALRLLKPNADQYSCTPETDVFLS